MIRLPKFQSLYANFLVILIPLTFIPFISIVLTFEYLNYNQTHLKLLQKLNQLSVHQSILLSEPLWQLNKGQIQAIIKATVSDPDIVFVEIIDKSGKAINTYGQPPADHELVHSSSIHYYGTDVSKIVGTLTLGGTDKHIVATALEKVEYGVFLVIFLILSVLISTVIAQHYAIGIPLQRLLDAINQTKTDDKLQLIDWDSNDEIGHVIRAYNIMQQNQNTYKKELKKNTTEINDTIKVLKKEISEKIRIAEALQESEQRFRSLYDSNPLILFTVDSHCVIQSANQYGAKLLGYDKEELVGESILKIFHEEDKQSSHEIFRQSVFDRNDVHRREIRNIRKDGNIIWVRETIRIIHDKDNQINILIVSEDISETRKLTEQLSHQASHDSLTNLVNRGEFEQRLKRALLSARSNQSEHALCYMDLDQFKVINDTHGHTAGDELLRQIGQLLYGRTRRRDTLARLGGDEFGLLMEHCSLGNALQSAENLKNTISNYQFIWEGKRFTIGVSIGLVAINNKSHSTTDILKAADTACYAAKDMGRNRVHIYAEDDVNLTRHRDEMHWVTRVQQALEEDRFYLVAQIISPAQPGTNDNYSYELLLRMRDEDGSIVSPGKFLPAAERYGIATKIDRWVIKNALETLRNNTHLLSDDISCSLNLSGLSLADNEFLDFIKLTFHETQVKPNKICFEITETAAIANLASAMHFIESLKELGCRFALDDFGSGLSSFGYLKTLPVDYLKIDGFFVKDIVEDPIDYTMVKSINEIGHEMGKKTIAEFVENDAILNKLREIGVDYVQGYGVGRPQLLEELE